MNQYLETCINCRYKLNHSIKRAWFWGLIGFAWFIGLGMGYYWAMQVFK